MEGRAFRGPETPGIGVKMGRAPDGAQRNNTARTKTADMPSWVACRRQSRAAVAAHYLSLPFRGFQAAQNPDGPPPPAMILSAAVRLQYGRAVEPASLRPCRPNLEVGVRSGPAEFWSISNISQFYVAHPELFAMLGKRKHIGVHFFVPNSNDLPILALS